MVFDQHRQKIEKLPFVYKMMTWHKEPRTIYSYYLQQ